MLAEAQMIRTPEALTSAHALAIEVALFMQVDSKPGLGFPVSVLTSFFLFISFVACAALRLWHSFKLTSLRLLSVSTSKYTLLGCLPNESKRYIAGRPILIILVFSLEYCLIIIVVLPANDFSTLTGSRRRFLY